MCRDNNSIRLYCVTKGLTLSQAEESNARMGSKQAAGSPERGEEASNARMGCFQLPLNRI